MNNCQKLVVWPLLIMLAITDGVTAQERWTTTELLGLMASDSADIYAAQLRFLNEENQNLPWARKLEFRTETDEFEAGRQEYSMRLSVNGRRMREAQDRINEQRRADYQLRERELADERLTDYFSGLADWYYASENLRLLNTRDSILRDQQIVLDRMIAAGESTDVEDVLQLRRSIQRLELSRIRLEQRVSSLTEALSPSNDRLQLSTRNWISVGTMQRILNALDSINKNNIAADRQLSDVRLAEMEVELEESEGKQLLDFLSLKYAGRNNLGLAREFSVGASFNIPLRSNNRINRNEAALELLDEQVRFERLLAETKRETTLRLADFRANATEYFALESIVAEGQLEALLERYLRDGTAEPMELLEIKAYIIRQQIDLLELHEAVFSDFFGILRLQNLISADYGIDFLSDDLPRFNAFD
ncbi:hypothetical protein CEQ90_16040 [Lewinellaceae bacterium SD302]|nr:hypothetical protein CEQ90_16040 [Lewinellaceae bacterium SD302]